MENKKKYEERLKRVKDAVALKKTDMIPCIPNAFTFQYLRQGHTVAQALYDFDLAAKDNLKYHMDFQPDMAFDLSGVMAGEGPMLNRLQPKHLRWAGMPNCQIDENSMHQFIEKAYLEDGEYPEILGDISKWAMRKLLPRRFATMECFSELDFSMTVDAKTTPAVWIRQFRNPKIAETFKMLSEVAEQYEILGKKSLEHRMDLMNAGFPMYIEFGCTTAFDGLSDTFRGTLEIMMDLLDDPELLHEAINMFHKRNIEEVHMMLGTRQETSGSFFFIPLHKGFDGFMSPKQYEEFYFPTLKLLVEEIIKCGGTPLVYTEGKYDSRLEYLSDLPAGKVLIHMEDVDMKEAKRIVGKDHCLSGGFKSSILKTHTPDQIREEVKRFLDVVAVDGGYIFDVDYTLDDVNDKAVEAVFDTVRRFEV